MVKQLIDLPHRVGKDGRRIFTLEHTIVNATNRPEPTFGNRKSRNEQNEEEYEVGNAESDVGQHDGLVRQRWRLLSAVQAWPNTDFFWPQLVDYSYKGGEVLKQIIPIVNKTLPDLMRNHSDDVADIIGRVENAKWEDSTDIPPGVNADLVIDPEIEEKEAKKLSKGLYRSGSIGIVAEMRKSHEDMDDFDFLTKQGKKVNGEIVRWLPSKITAVRHMAIVPAGAGADKNAGVRNNIIDSKLTNQKNISGGKNMNNNIITLFNTIADLLRLDHFDPTWDEIPDDYMNAITEKIKALCESHRGYVTLCNGLKAFENQLKKEDEIGLKAEEIIDRIRPRLDMAKHGEAFLIHQRKEALKWFDTANVQPDRKELSDLERKMRSRIENSNDLDFISEQLEYWKIIAEQKLGLNRSSEAEELTIASTKIDPKKLEIAESAKKLHMEGE